MSRVTLCPLLAVAAVVAVAGPAGAGVTPIGEFVGEVSEGFEMLQPPGSYPDLAILGGAATMKDTLATIAVISYIWQGPGGTVYPYAGNLFAGTPAGSTLFTFATPIRDFGGYMTTVSDVPNGSVVFRDVQGVEIATLPLTITPTIWQWQGWRSDTPVKSIEVIGGGPFGNRPMQYDELQIAIPEPGSLGLIALGAGLVAFRRR